MFLGWSSILPLKKAKISLCDLCGSILPAAAREVESPHVPHPGIRDGHLHRMSVAEWAS
jgi:hypothetical protein